jgi:alkylresorcinol/alkylpyrone synthase
MQRRLPRARGEALAKTGPSLDVEILSIATANPRYKVDQRDAWERAKGVFPHLARMQALYTNTGIESRYSCVPADWCQSPHSWEERTHIYQRNALELLEQVSLAAVAEAGMQLADIDMLVLNTITGLAIPSLDARLMNRLAFRPTLERLPIFGLGCGGGVAGLARAARLAQGCPGANVLFLTVDLCSLCARPNDPSVAMFVSAALFGDGAAAVVLRSGGGAATGARDYPVIHAAGEHCWRNTEHIMGWDIKSDGFGVVLSPELPSLMQRELRPALDAFLARNGLELEGFSGFLLHPGGRKVLETAEVVLGIARSRVAHSWEVLRDYGNMSSVTAMFVLQRALAAGDRGRHLLAAFGPGFSAYFIAVDL